MGLIAGPTRPVRFTSMSLALMPRHRRDLLQRQLEELQVAVTEQMCAVQQARHKREVLDSLRDSQLREYRIQRQRREQVQFDELHLLGRARNRGAGFA